MLEHKIGQNGLGKQKVLKFHSLTETCLLCSWEGDTPLPCLPDQDYLYSAAMHLLMLEENFKLLLGCRK